MIASMEVCVKKSSNAKNSVTLLQPVPVAERSESHALIAWTLRLWVRILLKVRMFVLVYSSSFSSHPVIDVK
jgi:hypothetical protein